MRRVFSLEQNLSESNGRCGVGYVIAHTTALIFCEICFICFGLEIIPITCTNSAFFFVCVCGLMEMCGVSDLEHSKAISTEKYTPNITISRIDMIFASRIRCTALHEIMQMYSGRMQLWQSYRCCVDWRNRWKCWVSIIRITIIVYYPFAFRFRRHPTASANVHWTAPIGFVVTNGECIKNIAIYFNVRIHSVPHQYYMTCSMVRKKRWHVRSVGRSVCCVWICVVVRIGRMGRRLDVLSWSAEQQCTNITQVFVRHCYAFVRNRFCHVFMHKTLLLEPTRWFVDSMANWTRNVILESL